jgi:hypothetical protein
MDHRFEKGKNSCANCGLKAKRIVTFGYECVTEAPPPAPDWHLALTRGDTTESFAVRQPFPDNLPDVDLYYDPRPSMPFTKLDGAQTLLVKGLLAAIDSLRGMDF